MLLVFLDLVLTLLLAGHLLCMNLASGLPLFCVLLQWQTRGGDARDAMEWIRRFVGWAIAAVILGSLTGLLIGGLMWLMQDRALMEVLPRFERKIWWGLTELVFYVVFLGIYLRLLRSPAGTGRMRWWIGILLAVAAGTNLLYHFPPLFSVMAMVSHDPRLASDAVSPQEFRSLMLTGKVFSMTVHFWLASLAITGVFAADRLLAARSAEASGQPRDVERFVRWSIGIALVATSLQLLVGTWVLVRIGPLGQSRLLGGDGMTTVLFALGLVAVLMVLHRLAKLFSGEGERKQARRALHWMILIVVLMTGAMRHAERTPPQADRNAAVSSAPRGS